MKNFHQLLKEYKIGSHEPTPNVLTEAVSVKDMARVGSLISSYFSRKLGTNMVRMPGGEEYFNETGSGFGIRFFIKNPINGVDSIRFNWSKKNIDSAAVDSVDVFSQGSNTHNVAFDRNTSLVKVLPFMVNFINNPSMGYVTMLDDADLNEANADNPVEAINDYLVRNNITEPMTKGKLYQMIKNDIREVEKPSTAIKLFDAIKKTNPHMIQKVGRTQKMDIGGGALGRVAEELFNAMFTRAKVTSGSKKETTKESDDVEELEDQGLERVAFEQQLEDMKQAVRLLYRGVTNAVFIGGRGGIGKTHNVEKVLEELGLQDGEGYFKNAGSISASGLYRLLFKKRNELVLFDDSDNVFGDQEARNVLKGATDTKPVRKLSWSKQSSDIINPDDFTDEDEEKGRVPQFFEFTGKIIFISNLDTDKLDPDGALRTRGILIDIDPTDEEIYDLMEKIVDDFDLSEGLTLSSEERQEVIRVLRSNPAKSPNFRTLARALNMRAGWDGDGWERYVVYYA